MNRGETLPEALGNVDIELPRSYRVIVEAGLKAGNLTAALEGVSSMAWKMSELRRRIGLAMIYPLMVLMLAYGLFVLTCVYLAPRMRFIFDSFGVAVWLYDLLTEVGRYANPWGWVFPLLIVGLIIWWRRSGQQFLTGDGAPSGPACLCPGVRNIARFYRSAQFADLLALLIEHDVPMPQAIVLAAETTNDHVMQNAARAIADATSRGLFVSNMPNEKTGFPPFLHWLITRREEQEGLVSALRAAADMYRRRAVLITEWIQVAFPVFAAVVIGGGATLLYTLTVFLPITEILKALSEPFI
jgi:general secretion pathway protein F